ncbi:hypothetical protein DFP72DRAFT_1121646 [Ephemerocybe angulata]|uniref:NACHT domain-containing protein n=1 Tax=Ephemerocybe angulata TaxID=980116 RepID=A0A8H6HY67_9AGAR|nr:hypothetical protein DFP72DRAFT_1121646 [Tulosesus angulatus]
MPETRIAVQEEILSWITDGHMDTEPKRILWVTGPAGTGKTAILGTIAERCKAEGMLASTFFFSSFSGSLARRSKTCLVSTLARLDATQLSSRVQKRLQTQLDELILLPLRHGAPAGASPLSQHRMAIIIDGLDECDYVEDRFGWSASARISSGVRWTKEDEQREILSALLHAATDPSFPFVIIIASRPELAIREFFSTGPARDATRELFLDDKYKPDADILLFYDSKFSYIPTVMRFVEGPPPGTQDAAPVVQGLRTPHQRLMRIIDLSTQIHTPNVRPLEALDILYDSVMRTCSEPLLSMRWLGVIRLLSTSPYRSGNMPPRLLRLWMEQSPGDEVCVLGPLSSLIYIPSDPNCDKLYTFYHKSFVDFFEDKSRCVGLYVSPTQIRDFLSQRYFENMDKHLHRIPNDLLYHTLDHGSGDRTMFIFSSKDAFKTAERAMLSCDARKWAEYFTAPGTDGSGDPRVIARYLILRMFYAVHVWCSKIRCRRACKHWRKAILDVARKRGWTDVPHPLELFRDNRIRHYTVTDMYLFFNAPGEQTNDD